MQAQINPLKLDGSHHDRNRDDAGFRFPMEPIGVGLEGEELERYEAIKHQPAKRLRKSRKTVR